VKSVRSIGLGVELGLQCRRKLFLIRELKARAKGLRKFLKFTVSEMPFPGPSDLGELDLTENSISVCRNLQFSSTEWAKAYLVNYILDKLQESMRNIFIICSLSWMIM
jgi:hypothetical protein